MPLLIAELKFVNLDAVEYDFVPNDAQRVTTFSGSLPTRGSNTGKMGMHGFNPRRTLFEGLQIQHEGLFLATAGTYEEASAALVAEHDAMIACLLGDLASPPAATSLGTLTVQLAGWDQAYAAPAQVSSWSWDLTRDSIRTSPYMIGWTLETPCLFAVDSSGAQKVV